MSSNHWITALIGWDPIQLAFSNLIVPADKIEWVHSVFTQRYPLANFHAH